MLVDIDGFKALNHSLGSATGDPLLIEIGLRLPSALREGDFAAPLPAFARPAVRYRFGKQVTEEFRCTQRSIFAPGISPARN